MGRSDGNDTKYLLTLNNGAWDTTATVYAANDQTLTITVETTRGPQTFSVAKTAKVIDVATEAARLAGLASNDRFDLFLKTDLQRPLQSERTLVSYHISDGTVFVLSQVGSGV